MGNRQQGRLALLSVGDLYLRSAHSHRWWRLLVNPWFIYC